MKLLRHGEPGRERPGLVDETGQLRDLSGVVRDIGGDTLLPQNLERLRALDPKTLPPVEGTPRIGPCVGGVGKFVCVGLNYSDHAAESGLPVPSEPVLFMKATSAICGPNDDVEIPRGSEKTDWEVELGIVIGKPAKYVSEADALSHVAGYCVVNDVSERAFQIERGGQWDKGKGCDTFGPIGPWLVTADEVPDPQDLHMWLEVDGQPLPGRLDPHDGLRRRAPRQLHQPVHEPAAGRRHLDRHPAGRRDWARSPQSTSGPGQTMRLGIQGLGEQTQTTVPAQA